MRTYENFTDAYVDLCHELLHSHEFDSAPRGQKIIEKLGVQFRIRNPRDRLPLVKARDFSMSYLVAETIWYMSGNSSTEWISKYAPFWKHITDDGVTANSAYGARIFKSHPRIAGGNIVQWNYVKEELAKDPDSRRAVIHIRTPSDSIVDSKDVPCTLSLQFFVRRGALHLHVSMRSSDIILGLAYDVPAFTIMQEVMANELGLELGHYVHTSNSLHCYEKDFKMLRDISNEPQRRGIEMTPLPNPFPSSELMRMESAVSSMNDEQLRSGVMIVSPPFDREMGEKQYNLIHDWSKILMSRRLRKIGENHLATECTNNVSDSSYKFFNR